MLARRTERTAFTLLELLVVVSIIATLAALSAGAFFRVRSSQQEKLTGERLTQLQKTLLQQWTAALDDAKRQPIPDIVKFYAQDPDRAKSIWAYLHLRRNFPETVAEAQAQHPTNPMLSPGIYLLNLVTGQYELVLNRNEKIWTSVQGAGTLPLDEQSAICLYVSLVEINRRGMESGLTDSMVKTWPPTGTGQYKVFTDTFNVPISFRRFCSTAEMDATPYFANPTALNLGKRDPLDPYGKLSNYDFPPNLLVAIGGNRMIPLPSAASPTVARFPGTNFVPTVISYGLNKKFEVDGTGQPNGDDLYGYRLNVEGRTGN